MFSRTRRRIVAAIMAALILFLLTTLLVIYLSSYRSIRRQNAEMLERHADMYLLEGGRGGDLTEQPPPLEEPRKNDPREERQGEPSFRLYTYYSVEFAADGTVQRVEEGNSGLYSREELIALARQAMEKGEDQGVLSGLTYTLRRTDQLTLVAFVDNAVTDRNMQTLLWNMLVTGGIAVAVIFVIALSLAKVIVKPLEENDRRQRQFVSDAGHELKTPIAVINANTELLAREIPDNEWLNNIQYENGKMGTLVIQLLDLSRAENARVPFERVDLSRLVTGEALPFETVAFEKGLTVVSDIREEVFVEGNATQLRQLTGILLDNALRYAQGDPEIRLTLKAERHAAHLSVSNAGDPIPPEKQARLFERFYRADEARTEEGNHYGLGLAIAKAIAEGHRGSIALSCGNGRVEFTVTLPLQK